MDRPALLSDLDGARVSSACLAALRLGIGMSANLPALDYGGRHAAHTEPRDENLSRHSEL